MRNLRSKTGFTVVEVVLALAISGLIFVAAMTLFFNQTGETTFSLTMQDLSSEITDRLKEVGTNLSAAYQQYSCSVDTTYSPPHAVLKPLGLPNTDCLYLGKAIYAANGSSTIYFYTILGNRLVYQGITPTVPTQNFSDANPVPAVKEAGSTVDLTQNYSLRSAQVTNTRIYTSPSSYTDGNYYLLGYYTDLQGGSDIGTNSNPRLLAEGYNIGSGVVSNGVIASCIDQATGNPCTQLMAVSRWTLCFADTGSSRNAKLDIYNSAAGITTSLQFNMTCPG